MNNANRVDRHPRTGRRGAFASHPRLHVDLMNQPTIRLSSMPFDADMYDLIHGKIEALRPSQSDDVAGSLRISVSAVSISSAMPLAFLSVTPESGLPLTLCQATLRRMWSISGGKALGGVSGDQLGRPLIQRGVVYVPGQLAHAAVGRRSRRRGRCRSCRLGARTRSRTLEAACRSRGAASARPRLRQG